MSKVKQADIDLATLSPKHLQIVQDTYKVLAVLLDDNRDKVFSRNEEELKTIKLIVDNIKVRDGLFNYVGTAPYEMRVDIIQSLIFIIMQTMMKKDYDDYTNAYLQMVLAAVVFAHAGAKQDASAEVDNELKLIKELMLAIDEVFTEETEPSFYPLLKTAITCNVPPIVFYQSITALSFEEYTRP